jgi:hypothetical protein
VLNPVLALFEQSNQVEIENGDYESNWEYYTRNSLTTLAILLLSVFTVGIGFGLNRELNNFEKLRGGVRLRAIILSTIMETALALRLFMIWSQNVFWYMDS